MVFDMEKKNDETIISLKGQKLVLIIGFPIILFIVVMSLLNILTARLGDINLLFIIWYVVIPSSLLVIYVVGVREHLHLKEARAAGYNTIEEFRIAQRVRSSLRKKKKKGSEVKSPQISKARNCPACGQPLTQDATVCPLCHFHLPVTK